MREIILDTETTGLDPSAGHRIVEIGAVELFNHIPTGRTYHAYINPERAMPSEAEAVHGLSAAFLRDKPIFSAILQSFQDFIADALLIIHNASFDVGFLNAEFGYLGQPPILPERVVDTLLLARQKHPSGSNSLDALCRRYGIDNSRRTKHGALLDSELLAEVYLELIGGRQTALKLAATAAPARAAFDTVRTAGIRPRTLISRLTQEDREAHDKFVQELGAQALWKNA